MADRVVKVSLVIDDHGSVKTVRSVGDEAGRTESKLGKLDKGVKGLGKSFSGLKGMLAGGLGLVGAGGLVFGLEDVISKTKGVAEETEKFHSVTGIGAKESLKYTQALKARGLSGEAVNKAFGFLAKNIRTAELQEKKFGESQAKGTLATQKQQLALAKAVQGGKALAIAQAQLGIASSKSTTEVGRQAKAVQELGINMGQYVKMTEPQKLKAITTAFENLAAGEKKTRLEKELFGRGGQQLSTVLEKNSLSLNHYMGLVEKYYGTLKGGAGWETQLLEKQSEAKLAWEGLQFQLGTKLTPVLIKVFSWFSKVVQQIESGHGSWGRLARDVEGVAKFLKGLWQGFEKTVGPANALKVALVGLTAIKFASFSKGFAAMGLSAVAAAPELLALAAAVLTVYEAYKHAKEIQTFFGVGGTETKYAPHQRSAAPELRAGGRGNRSFAEALIKQGTSRTAGPQEQREAGAAVQSIAQEIPQVKADLHIDSLKVAEAIAKNPRAIRRFSEDVAHYGLKRAARE